MAKIVTDLIKIFKSSVNAVVPESLIKNSLKFNSSNQELSILGDKYKINYRNVYLVGTGKAVQNMAKEVELILKTKIKSGIISIPVGSLDHKYRSDNNVHYYEGAKNNLPDIAAEATTNKIKNLVQGLDNNDLLIVLISGGGSALLPMPKVPIKLKEKMELIKKLANSGADIKELNTVRKKLSDIKGGQLALKAQPATVISLILSDIVGDPLDLIASGPTVENEDNPEKAMNIIKKYKLLDIPNSIKHVLNEKYYVGTFPKDNVKNYIIGSNKISINAATIECRNLNYLPLTLSHMVTGDVKTIAEEYVKLAALFCNFMNGQFNNKLLKDQILKLEIPGLEGCYLDQLNNCDISNKNICLIMGGEITVEVKGTGIGGRNQQLALEFSKCLYNISDNIKNFHIYLLSGGTDGIDGPTNAAGAVGYGNLIEDSKNENLDANNFIENNDSYNFYKQFKNGKYHLITGHTNTNVMDLHFIIIKRK